MQAGGEPQASASFRPSLPALAVATFAGAVFYATVAGFLRPTPLYHAEISLHLVLWAALALAACWLFDDEPVFPQGAKRLPWIVLFACLLVATALAGSDAAWLRARLYFAVIFLGLALLPLLRRAGDTAIPLVLLALAIVHALLLAQVVHGLAVAEPATILSHTWIPQHANIRHVAYHGMIAAAAGVALATLWAPLRLAGILLAAAALSGIVYFGSRGAVLGMLVFALAALALGVRRRSFLVALAAAVVMAFAAASWFHAFVLPSPQTGLVDRMQSASGAVGSPGRIEIWLNAVAAIGERPWFGYGPEGYLSSRCCGAGSVQPHNAALQFALEIGIVGTLLLLWFGWKTLGRRGLEHWRNRRLDDKDEAAVLVFSILVGVIGYSAVDGLFYHVVPLTLFAILCAAHAARAGNGPAGAGG